MVKLKVGDKVRIVRKQESGENGWDNSWVPNMDSFVNNGQIYRIEHIAPYGVSLDKAGFDWPLASLELAFPLLSPEEQVKTKIKNLYLKSRHSWIKQWAT